MRRPTAFVLLVAIVLNTLVTTTWGMHKYKMLFGRPMHGFTHQEFTVSEMRRMMADGETKVKAGFYKQTLNHNAKTGDRDLGVKFNQQFFMNDEYYKAGGPEFLYIGGEGPESGSRLMVREGRVASPMVDWAKKQNARLWLLEHRFYGSSRPFKFQTTDVLQKYLHSDQALDDLAEFIKSKNAELKLGAPKWIVFGGSYPGALTLWFRQKYPDLTVGGVGSSAPIEPRLDFYDYLRVCEDSYSDATTWGSKDCADSIKSAFQAVSQLMDYKEGRDYLDKAFSLYPTLAQTKLTDQNVANFYSNLVGYFQGAVQYNRINGGIYKDAAGIPEVCNLMQFSSYGLLSGLVNVTHYFSEVYGVKFDKLFDSYGDMIGIMNDTAYYGDGGLAAARSWTWQTCNEFGYFQSTDIGRSIFGDLVPNSLYINMCVDVFGPEYNYDYVKSKVRETVKRYGGRKGYKGTNVVAPNGKIDPWHALGLRDDDIPESEKTRRKVVTFTIPDTAHCADMGPPLDRDSPALKKARDDIYTQIQGWLGVTPTSVDGGRVKRSLNETQHEKWNLSKVSKSTKLDHIKPMKNLAKHQSFDDRPALSYTTETIEQIVDHTITPTTPFTQTLYRINKYVKNAATDPLIVFILLEDSVETYAKDDNSPITSIASQLNAGLLFIRTRYFGASKVGTDLTTESLKYLTLYQILEDIRTIIDGQTGRAPTAKTIVVGSGLGGTIAAHFRKKFSNVVVGALSSSSPIDFQLTYPENNLRVRAYLQCNELGFLPNTDYGYSIFGNLVSPNFLVDLCRDVFGLTHTQMHENVAKTLETYKSADEFDATNVIFSYGNFDPNFPASFHGNSDGSDRTQLLIPKAGVSNDLIDNSKTQEAQQARQQILDKFKQWLK